MNNSKIKLIHLVPSLDTGGMENGVINLLNWLDRTRFEPIIYCLKKPGSMINRLKPDVKVVTLNFQEGKSFFRPFMLAGHLKKEKPDIVHTHGWGGGSWDGVIGARIAKTPVVINGEHGCFFLKTYQIFLQKIIAALSNATLSVSESLKKEIVVQIGVASDSIKTIRNGVDAQLFSGKHDTTALNKELSARFKIDSQNKPFFVACIGSLKPVKNQILLLECMREIKNSGNHQNIKALIIGEGPDSSDLKEFVKDSNLSGTVLFLGQRSDVPQLLSIISVLVLTSISEGMSNVLLEAMSSGVPVIAARSQGASEFIQEGINGFIVNQNNSSELSEKIVMLASNQELWRKVSDNAKKTVLDNFSIAKMVSTYENLYTFLLEKQKNKER